MTDQKPTRDDVLRRMLKTSPEPHKPIGKRKVAEDDDDIPPDSPERVVEGTKRKI